MSKQVFLNRPNDMNWLFDVHCPEFRGRARAALLEGNEDSPERVTLWETRRPHKDETPLDVVTFDDTRSEAMRMFKTKTEVRVYVPNPKDGENQWLVCRMLTWPDGPEKEPGDRRYVMEGLTGAHSLMAHDEITPFGRLLAHWRVFRSSNVERVKLVDQPWRIPPVPAAVFYYEPAPKEAVRA